MTQQHQLGVGDPSQQLIAFEAWAGYSSCRVCKAGVPHGKVQVCTALARTCLVVQGQEERHLQGVRTWEFPGGPVVSTPLSLLRAPVRYLVREVRSHKLQGTAGKKKESEFNQVTPRSPVFSDGEASGCPERTGAGPQPRSTPPGGGVSAQASLPGGGVSAQERLPGGGASAPQSSQVSRFLSGRSFRPLPDPGPPGRELDCQRPLHLGLPVPEPALTRGPQPPGTQRVSEGAPRCMPLPPLPASALLEGLPPPPFSPGPLTSPEGVLFPEAFSPPNRLRGWAWSWGSQPSPPTSLADISCVFGADTLILKPGVPKGLRDPGVPPHHPALPGRNATTTVTGSGAGPDPAPAGCDYIFVLYSSVPWAASGSLGEEGGVVSSRVEGKLPLAGPVEDRHPLP